MSVKRTRGLFSPASAGPFKLSRTKLENFLQCPRCFYLDRRLGIDRPSGPPFTLNSAVDHLLKKEFDIHRAAGTAHPLMTHYGVDAVPFAHEEIDRWRQNFVGLQYRHPPTNFIVTGAIDDLWKDNAGKLIVVDYKATSTANEISLDDVWKQGFKRQMEIYQWLLRQMGFSVSAVGYFVYANGRRDRQAFDGKLEFDVQLIAYEGGGSWVEPAIIKAKECLTGDVPPSTAACEYCLYRRSAREVELP